MGKLNALFVSLLSCTIELSPFRGQNESKSISVEVSQVLASHLNFAHHSCDSRIYSNALQKKKQPSTSNSSAQPKTYVNRTLVNHTNRRYTSDQRAKEVRFRSFPRFPSITSMHG